MHAANWPHPIVVGQGHWCICPPMRKLKFPRAFGTHRRSSEGLPEGFFVNRYNENHGTKRYGCINTQSRRAGKKSLFRWERSMEDFSRMVLPFPCYKVWGQWVALASEFCRVWQRQQNVWSALLEHSKCLLQRGKIWAPTSPSGEQTKSCEAIRLLHGTHWNMTHKRR